MIVRKNVDIVGNRDDYAILSRNGSKGKADRKNVVWEVLILSDYSLQSSAGSSALKGTAFSSPFHLSLRGLG